MRKILALTIVILLLSVAGVGFALHKWNAQAKDVSYELRTISGDRRLLDGLEIEMYDSLNSELLWHTKVEFTADRNTGVTALKKTDEAEVYEIYYRESEFNEKAENNSRVSYTGTEPLGVTFSDRGVDKACERSEIPEKVEDPLHIKPSEYFSYMPIRFGLNVYHMKDGWRDLRNWDRDLEYCELNGDISEAIAEAIRLPVPKNLTANLNLTAELSQAPDTVFEAIKRGMAGAGVYSTSICTEDAIWFAVGYDHEHYNVWWDIDTSTMPLGYGVYRVPYSVIPNPDRGGQSHLLTIDVDHLELFCKIDPDAYAEDIFLSEDQQELFLVTRKKTGELALTVTSIQGGEPVSKIILVEGEEIVPEEETAVPHMSYKILPAVGEACYVIHLSMHNDYPDEDDRIAAIARNSDGSWEQVITIAEDDIAREYPWQLREMQSFGKFAYDGERLAYVGETRYAVSVYSEYLKDFTLCHQFCLYVTDRNGRTYAGTLSGSLQKAYLPSEASVRNIIEGIQWK